jgi:4-hydroxybenzoate polyprenyltransferase
VKQWAKNALIFIPLFLAGMATDLVAWRDALFAFFGLGFVASATYLLNDLFDLADDRRHWTKRNRPLASGALPIGEGLMLVPVLAVAGFALAAAAGWAVFATVMLYTAITLAYSFHVKRVPILDVAVLATLFTLRLFLGVVAIGAVISPWLFVFSMALFLSLSTAKRHTEVVRMALHGKTKTAGRGYIARDEPMLLALGLAAAMSAVVLFSLYLTAEAFQAAMYTAPGFLWATPILLFLWLGRIWLVSQRGELDDDPVAFALKDKASLALGCMLGLAFGGAIFGGFAMGALPWIA